MLVVDNAAAAVAGIGAFRDRPKLLSWLVLWAAGLPALRGVIVARWDPATARAVQRFVAELEGGALLVRSDAPRETGRSPRGGYLVRATDIGDEARRLLLAGRTPFFLEPASPFNDLYSATLEPDDAWRDWSVEIVGPGFDASDLKRGDVTPHERIRVALADGVAAIREREVATQAVQAAVRTIRIEKVARAMDCDPGTVEHELRERDETLLFDAAAYPPIPPAMVTGAVEEAARLRDAFGRFGLSARAVSISLSFLGRTGRLTFWDVVWPSAKYVITST